MEITSKPYLSLFQAIIDRGADFWYNHVEKRIAPDFAFAKSETLQKLFPNSNGETIEMPPQFETICDEYLTLKGEIGDREERITEIQNEIKAFMEEAEVAETPSFKVSWKTSKPSARFDRKGFASEHPDLAEEYTTYSTSRPMRITAKKK